MEPTPTDDMPPDLGAREGRLRELLAGYGRVVVAFSGGVDSTLLAAVAHEVLGDRASAITGVSPALAESERAEARALAARIGIAHREVITHELDRAGYVENSPERCFHCKDELYGVMTAVLSTAATVAGAAVRDAVIVDGTNLDDTGDHRPGRRAALTHGVRSPLLEAGLSKADIRALSRARNLPTWDKPAMACLASRLPYGTSVTVQRLRQVGGAEQALHALGFRELRVRHHGDVARVEVPPSTFERMLDADTRAAVVEAVRAAGFAYVALDLQGLRSGALNEVLSLLPPSAPLREV